MIKLTVQPVEVIKDIKPVVGTESCQAKHTGVIVEGTVTCRHNDGTEVTYSGGDATIEPGRCHGLLVINLPLLMNFMVLGDSKS